MMIFAARFCSLLASTLCRYAHVPLDDSMPDTIAASAAHFIPFLRTAWPLVSGAIGGVLVHCSAGKHRSCSVACALLMMLGCPSLEHAFQYVVRERAICKPSFWPLLESDEFEAFLLEVRGEEEKVRSQRPLHDNKNHKNQPFNEKNQKNKP
jgi:protein-tyrosine phosphatase